MSGKLLRFGSLGVSRGSGIAAQMAAQIAVGSLAGPAGIGTLQLHMAWSSMLGELVGGGEATAAMREHSLRKGQVSSTTLWRSLWSAGRNILNHSALLLALVFLLSLSGLLEATNLDSRILMISILVSAPLFAITRLLAETLKALDRALWAVTLENSLIPVVILGFCGVLALGILPASQSLLLTGAISGLLLTVLLMALSLHHHSASKSAAQPKESNAAAAPRAGGERVHFWLNGLLNIAFLQLPFLIMPWLVSANEIGGYAVAHKLVNIITTLLILLSAVYSPRFACAASAGDRQQLGTLLGETQRISLLLFIPAALLLLGCSSQLADLFSLSPSSLLPLLIILATGQLLNAATGLSGVLLNMSGAAKTETQLLLASCLFTLFLAGLLGLSRGASGVALGVATGIALRNLTSYYAARRHINFLGED
jgi:O-antigen/teichoic acid export membrane protein